VFINVRPFNSGPVSKDIAIPELRLSCVHSARVPVEGHADDTTIIQRNLNGIFVRVSADGAWLSFKD